MPPSWSETSDRATLHHMLSKKIAQLTKVIYHLNTKNEDQETRLVDLQQRYETEIEKMEADARANFVAHSALGLGRRGGSPFRLRLRTLRIQEIRRPLPEADARIRLAACAGNPEEARALRKSELGRDRPEAKSARGSGSSTDRIALRTFAPCSFRQGCLCCTAFGYFDDGMLPS